MPPNSRHNSLEFICKSLADAPDIPSLNKSGFDENVWQAPKLSAAFDECFYSFFEGLFSFIRVVAKTRYIKIRAESDPLIVFLEDLRSIYQSQHLNAPHI